MRICSSKMVSSATVRIYALISKTFSGRPTRSALCPCIAHRFIPGDVSGWYRFDGEWVSGALAFIFPAESARRLLSDPLVFDHRVTKEQGLADTDRADSHMVASAEPPHLLSDTKSRSAHRRHQFALACVCALSASGVPTDSPATVMSRAGLAVSFADERQGHLGKIYRLVTGSTPGTTQDDYVFIHGEEVHPRTVLHRYESRSIAAVAKAEC